MGKGQRFCYRVSRRQGEQHEQFNFTYTVSCLVIQLVMVLCKDIIVTSSDDPIK